MKNSVVSSREELALLQEEFEDNPPAAVLDFLEADAEIRPQIEGAFKRAKTYAKRAMRSEWYRWKTTWTRDAQGELDEEIQNLEVGLPYFFCVFFFWS